MELRIKLIPYLTPGNVHISFKDIFDVDGCPYDYVTTESIKKYRQENPEVQKRANLVYRLNHFDELRFKKTKGRKSNRDPEAVAKKREYDRIYNLKKKNDRLE